jgi:hypothetical protein
MDSNCTSVAVAPREPLKAAARSGLVGPALAAEPGVSGHARSVLEVVVTGSRGSGALASPAWLPSGSDNSVGRLPAGLPQHSW